MSTGTKGHSLQVTMSCQIRKRKEYYRVFPELEKSELESSAHSPEEASLPELLSGGWELSSKVSMSEHSRSARDWGLFLKGPCLGWSNVCCSESSSKLNGDLLSQRGRNEGYMDQKNFKSHTLPLASGFGLPRQPALLLLWAQVTAKSHPGVQQPHQQRC